MPRIQFSDVTPPDKKRSIRNIPIPKGGRRKASSPTASAKSDYEAPPAPAASIQNLRIPPQPVPEPQPLQIEKKENFIQKYYPKEKLSEQHEHQGEPPKSNKKIFWSAGVLAAVVIFVAGMMTVFASATVTLVPKSQQISADADLAASAEPQEGAVRYEVVKLSKTKTVSVPAAGEEAAEIKASGKIVIYNNFSTEPQRLMIRTRFETPEGLIYRIPESVTVPGKSVKGGAETPGSIEVEVFADEAGEKYNIKKTDFTIPGFKGDPARYKAFFARSSTNMAGGFIGKRKTVLASDKQAAMQSMDAELQSDLKKDLESKLPPELAMLAGSVAYKSSDLADKEDGSAVAVGKEMTAYALLLDKENLSNILAAKYASSSAGWQGIKPAVRDLSGLSLSGLPADMESGGNLKLHLSGTARMWADVDPEAVKSALAGAPKGEAAGLLNKFAGIDSVTAAIRPIWKKSFPQNLSKIYVYQNFPE